MSQIWKATGTRVLLMCLLPCNLCLHCMCRIVVEGGLHVALKRVLSRSLQANSMGKKK